MQQAGQLPAHSVARTVSRRRTAAHGACHARLDRCRRVARHARLAIAAVLIGHAVDRRRVRGRRCRLQGQQKQQPQDSHAQVYVPVVTCQFDTPHGICMPRTLFQTARRLHGSSGQVRHKRTSSCSRQKSRRAEQRRAAAAGIPKAPVLHVSRYSQYKEESVAQLFSHIGLEVALNSARLTSHR